MSYLDGMNAALHHIEENLTGDISYEGLSRIVGVSVYEFSRIFSFMAGVSVSEYIRRRRLSRAAFDIQSTRSKIIDIALKYSYESPTTFSRAFKELHGTSPAAARKSGAELTIYPPISFTLQIKGVEPLRFRIEEREAFAILGMSGYLKIEDDTEGLTSLWNSVFDEKSMRATTPSFTKVAVEDIKKRKDMDIEEIPVGKMSLVVGSPSGDFMPEIVAAIDYASENGRVRTIFGILPDEIISHTKQHAPLDPALAANAIPAVTEEIPAATWAVFSFEGERTTQTMSAGYARILTEWFPESGYRRIEDIPHIEKFPVMPTKNNRQSWEIHMPVKRA